MSRCRSCPEWGTEKCTEDCEGFWEGFEEFLIISRHRQKCSSCGSYKVTGHLKDQCAICIALYTQEGVEWGTGYCSEWWLKKKYTCPKCGRDMESNEGNTGGVDIMLKCTKCGFLENIADHTERFKY